MNTTQLQTTLGPILGLIAGYFAAWWGIDQAQALGILTALCGVGYAVYNAFITRKSAMVSTVANMPEVNQVSLEKNVSANSSLMISTPDNVVIK